MTYRSTDTKGRTEIRANAALVGYRLTPAMPAQDALRVFEESIEINEWAASVRRHPSWSPAMEANPRYKGDPEWPLADLYFAREVLTRALRAFGTPESRGLTRLREDGRTEVADHADAKGLYCQDDDWCILEHDHPGDCDGDREMWLGPDVLYPVGELIPA